MQPGFNGPIRPPVALFDACLGCSGTVNKTCMPAPKQERWRQLCEMAVVESDPRRLNELFQEIDQLLSDAEDRPEPPDSLQSGTA